MLEKLKIFKKLTQYLHIMLTALKKAGLSLKSLEPALGPALSPWPWILEPAQSLKNPTYVYSDNSKRSADLRGNTNFVAPIYICGCSKAHTN